MKPSIPKGTRDFSATEVAKRNYIFSVIKHAFENFGFHFRFVFGMFVRKLERWKSARNTARVDEFMNSPG